MTRLNQSRINKFKVVVSYQYMSPLQVPLEIYRYDEEQGERGTKIQIQRERERERERVKEKEREMGKIEELERRGVDIIKSTSWKNCKVAYFYHHQINTHICLQSTNTHSCVCTNKSLMKIFELSFHPFLSRLITCF